MFNGEYFIYDGIRSDRYGLRIASFSSDSTEETAVLSPTLNSVKAARANRFVSSGVSYTAPPEFKFSMVADAPIHPQLRREILRWLLPNDTFKVLEVEQPDLVGVKYHCRFSDINIIYQSGWCVGFTGNLLFDSWYAYGTPRTIRKTLQTGYNSSDGTTKELPADVGDQTEGVDYIDVVMVNDSDMRDAYTYPIVTLQINRPFTVEGMVDEVTTETQVTTTENVYDESGNQMFEDDGTPMTQEVTKTVTETEYVPIEYDVIIENLTDNERLGIKSRAFKFRDLDWTTFRDDQTHTITIDNELKVIDSDDYDTYLEKFEDKNWLRLCPCGDKKTNSAIQTLNYVDPILEEIRNSANELRIWINGTITIEAPRYILIGF